MQTILASAIDPLPATTAMVGAIALLTAALGPWVPERMVLGVARFIRQRSRRAGGPAVDGTGTFWMLRAVRDRDEPLMWLSLSVLAAAAAGISLLTLVLTRTFVGVYEYMLDRFFWTNLTLAGLEWVGVALLIGPLCLVYGVVAATLAPVVGAGTRSQRRPPGVVSGVLVGLGAAWLAHQEWAEWALSGRQEFMAGVLAMFVLAGLSARLSQRADRLCRPDGDGEAMAPEVTAGAEALIWLLLVAWGIASVLVGSGWAACRSAGTSVPTPPSGVFGWCILVTAVGMGMASLYARGTRRSASGCGMAAWAAGVGAGGAATLTSYYPAATWGSVVQVLMAALPFGYALHYAERAWLARVGSETLGFAQLMSAVLGGLGIGVIAVRWWALPTLGAMGMMTGGALLMLASGGMMQIYEEDRPARIRHLRLALVFASLAGATVLFPADAQRWARLVRQRRQAEPTTLGLDWLASEELPPARRVCLIGVDPTAAAQWPGLGKAYVDIIPLVPGARSSGTTLPAGGRTQVLQVSAFRMLRLEHLRYDLSYQRGSTSRRMCGFAEYSAEWLARLARRTRPGGRVVIDAPLAGMTARAIAVIAVTFEHAMAAPANWVVVDAGGEPQFRLTAAPGSAVPAEAEWQGQWSPVEWLLADHPNLRAHSIQRDWITHALRTEEPVPVSSLVQWLNDCRSTGLTASRRGEEQGGRRR